MILLKVLKILSFAGLCILLINTIIYSIGFTQKGKAYRFFVLYLFTLFVIQAVAEVCATNNVNNHFIGTYYVFLPFLLLSFFFYNLFSDIQVKKKYFVKYFTLIITIGLLVQYFVYPDLYYEFNPLGLLVTTCTIIIYAVMYLFELISKQSPFHYVTIGIFIYFISSSLIFASLTSITVSFSQEISNFIWNINALLFIVYQLLILWEWKQTFYLKATKQD
jgi:hypothetical protein